MTGGGGIVYAPDPDGFRLDLYQPPFDPPSQCVPCFGAADPRCCQHVPKKLNLAPEPDEPRRRSCRPWKR